VAFGFQSPGEGSEISSYAQTLISSGRSTSDNHRILCNGCGQVKPFSSIWGFPIFTKFAVNQGHTVSMRALSVKTYCIQLGKAPFSPAGLFLK